MAGANFYTIVESPVDDAMQVRNAISILNGSWMGAYSNATIAKNPAFPLFLALAYKLHLPYGIAFGLLIILASLVFVQAIRPLVKVPVVRGLIYLFLIYNPVGFSYVISMRIYRNSLIPWAVLLFVSCMLGIYFRKDKSPVALIGWSVGGAVSLAFFWLLREDSIWMLAFYAGAMLFLILYWVFVAKAWKRLVPYLLLAIVPFAGMRAAVAGVSMMNSAYYGVYATEDRTQTGIGEVMSLLYKIDDPYKTDENIWISQRMIGLAQSVSPTLATLKDFPQCCQALAGGPEIYGDWTEWALRTSAANNGHYIDGAETNAFFTKCAEELEAAFADGRLEKKQAIYLSSQTKGMEVSDLTESAVLAVKTGWHMMSYVQCDAVEMTTLPTVSEQELDTWEELLRYSIPRSEDQMKEMLADSDFLTENAVAVRAHHRNAVLSNWIVKAYRYAKYALLPLMGLGWLFLTIELIVRRTRMNRLRKDSWIMMTGLGLTVFVNLFAVCLFSRFLTHDATGTVFCFYGNAGYTLIAAAQAIGIYCFFYFIIDKVREARAKEDAEEYEAAHKGDNFRKEQREKELREKEIREQEIREKDLVGFEEIDPETHEK